MQIYIIEALLLVFLIITTVCVIFCKDILCAAVIYSEFSFCAVLLYLMMGAPDVAFAKEERRGKKRIPTLGVACPVCGQGKVAENSKGFYCTRFREGCKFTIWKDALTRVGGPMLNAKLLKLCMEKKDVRGSTGTIHYDAGQIRFSPGER